MIEVIRAVDERGWHAFASVAPRVYSSDPNWVPEIGVDCDLLLDPAAASWRHAEGYVAWDSGVPVGRIAAIIDNRYIEHRKERTGFFGFYEALPNQAVANALFDAAARWAERHSLSSVVGPLSPSILYSAGILIGGNGRPPLVGMPYNPAYYAEQACAWGMHPVKDLHSFVSDDFYEKIARIRAIWARRRARSTLTFRGIDLNDFERDVEHLRTIYNQAFRTFWGFAPVSRDEFQSLANSFKPILDPDFAVFGELDGVPVAYLMGIPDVNDSWANASSAGEPARGNAPQPKPPRTVRVDMLAVRPDCSEGGAAALVTLELLRRIHEKGYSSIEAAPLLDDTSWWRSIRAALFAPEPTRVYRIFGWNVEPLAARSAERSWV